MSSMYSKLIAFFLKDDWRVVGKTKLTFLKCEESIPNYPHLKVVFMHI